MSSLSHIGPWPPGFCRPSLAWHLLRPTRRTASDYRTTPDQWKILAVLIVTIGLLIWGRFRHDLVALAALLATTLLGLVPTASAFAGFGHPAVMTVAGVLVMSAALEKRAPSTRWWIT